MTLASYGTKIDLRDVPARDRQALVLNTYGMLEPGQSLELLTDQDPEALHAALRERDPRGFGWDRSDASAGSWRVRIVRRSRADAEDGCCSCSCS